MSLKILLVFSLFSVLFIGAFWRPILGVLGYLTVYLIWNPSLWWGKGLLKYLPRPSFIAIVFLIIGSMLNFKKLNWSFSRREIELYLFLGLIWLSSFVFGIGMYDLSWMYVTKMTKLFIFIFFFIRVVQSLNDYKLVVWAFILAAIILSIQSHTASSGYFVDGRIEFLEGFDFGEANALAALSAFGMILIAIEMLSFSWWKKLICIPCIALIVDTIIMTQSRGVFLGLIIGAPYILFRVPAESRKQTYMFIVFAIVLFFILTDIKFISRMKTMSDELEYNQEEVLTRFDFWKASVLMFKDHPFGVGVKNFQKLIPYYDHRNPGLDAHNTYVLCYSEIGILGIALLLVIIGETLLQLRRIRLRAINKKLNKDVTHCAFALGIVVLIYITGYGMTHSVLYREIFWILLSMPICLENASIMLLSESQDVSSSEFK